MDPKESHSPATRFRPATSWTGPVIVGFWNPVTDTGVRDVVVVPVMTLLASCSRSPSTCSMICEGWVTNPMARVAAAITQAMSDSQPRPSLRHRV